MNTLIPAIGLCGYAELRRSGIWDATSAPSLRVLQHWVEFRKIPAHHFPGKTLFLVDEVAEGLRRHHWHWPKTIPRPSEIVGMGATEWQLVRFRNLSNLGIWSPSQLPCERNLRSMISLGRIPHYKISGMLFFHPEEVRHCIFGGTLIEVAA